MRKWSTCAYNRQFSGWPQVIECNIQTIHNDCEIVLFKIRMWSTYVIIVDNSLVLTPSKLQWATFKTGSARVESTVHFSRLVNFIRLAWLRIIYVNTNLNRPLVILSAIIKIEKVSLLKIKKQEKINGWNVRNIDKIISTRFTNKMKHRKNSSVLENTFSCYWLAETTSAESSRRFFTTATVRTYLIGVVTAAVETWTSKIFFVFWRFHGSCN